MMEALKPYSKAIFAGLAAGIAYAASASTGGFTVAEILQSVLAALGGAGVVYAAPKNAEK
jgi:hypothetical protein